MYSNTTVLYKIVQT